MKIEPFTWTADDITAGRIVCKPPTTRGGCSLHFAKYAYKICYQLSAETNAGFLMVAMTDGMILSKHLYAEEAATWLNERGMVPMEETWLIEMNSQLKQTLGLRNSVPFEIITLARYRHIETGKLMYLFAADVRKDVYSLRVVDSDWSGTKEQFHKEFTFVSKMD